MKFLLKKTSKVETRPGHQEERYHYESEDGQHTLVFNAGEEPWTWEIIGSVSKPLANALIEQFVEKGMSGNVQPFEDRVKELEVAV